MMLIEQTQLPDAALPVSEFRDHLQLGSGFSSDGLQDGVLVAQLRAALAVIEKETAKVLLTRSFQYVVTAWRDGSKQVLPVAPVNAVQSLNITDLGGGSEEVDAAKYGLVKDTHTPWISSAGWALPTIPVGGTAEIVFDAGFGDWADVPSDLAQAVMLMAAHYYENRSASVDTRSAALPLGVVTLCRRHKPIRLFGGGTR